MLHGWQKAGLADPRGNVLVSFIELILALRPRYALIENVRGILSASIEREAPGAKGFAPDRGRPGGVLSYIVVTLEKAGYGVSFNLYNAANFGAPQIRERVVFLCARNGARLPWLLPTHSEDGAHGLPKWRTLRDAIGGMEEEGQSSLRFPEKRLRWYRMIKEGQNWRSLPPEMQEEAIGKAYKATGGRVGFLRRLAWDKPCATLATSPAMPATDLAHPDKDRPLSVQEYKRIQGFPDDWVIRGSLAEQYRQIGNAVPPCLGLAAGKVVMAALRGERQIELRNFKYSRYNAPTDRTWRQGVLPMA